MRLPTFFYEQNLIPNWGVNLRFIELIHFLYIKVNVDKSPVYHYLYYICVNLCGAK